VGPLAMATVALALFVASARLVAVTAIAFGDGATVGAVYIPFASIEPLAAPPHPCPVTAVCTFQLTPALIVPVTLEKNRNLLKLAPDAPTNAYAGETLTETGPVCAAISTLALPVCDGSALLVAVRLTGFVGGTAAGAM